MRKVGFVLCFIFNFSAFSQSVTTLHDGIAFGDSAKLGWYSSFSSFRFLSTGETNLGLYFNNKNNYTFSSINNSVAKTDFLSNGRFTLGTGSLFASRRNSIVIPKNNNDTTAIIQSVGSPYAMLDFRANSGGTGVTLRGQSLGNIYGKQGEFIFSTPSSMNLTAVERLNIEHNHSLRIWEGNTLRLQQIGDKMGINPLPILGTYFAPSANLDVNGDIRSSVLAGTGKRPVFADENGVLEAGNSTEVVSYISNNIVADNSALNLITVANGRYINSSSSNASMLLPINIPNGATIKKIEVDFYDNSSNQNILISLRGDGKSSTNNFLEFLTLGASTAVRTISESMQFTINNEVLSYYLLFRAINGINTSSTSWPGNLMAIRNIRVTYEY